jgi:O-antigen ligase
MATVAPTFDSRMAEQREATSGAVRGRGWKYWLPLAVIGWALFVTDHEMWHAEVATGDGDVDTALSDVVSASSTLRQIGFLSIGLIGGLAFLAPSPTKQLCDYRLLATVFLMAGWTVLSALWSDEFGVALRRTLLPNFMILAAMGLARHWRPMEVCRLAVHLGVIYILIGIGAELRVGTFLRGDGYRFSGTLHPNAQAVNCAVAVLGSICLYVWGSEKGRRVWLVIAALAFAMLYLTGSRSSLFSLLGALAGLYVWRSTPRQRLLLGLVGGIFASGTLFVLLLTASVDLDDSMLDVVSLGRQQESGEVSSLTGRIPIWRELLRHIAQRPLLGYGYGAFWTGERVYELSAILNWEFNHAHSVYLETMLNLGGVGLALGLLMTVVAIHRAALAARQTFDPGFVFTLAWLGFAVLHGVLESAFVQPSFALMVAMIGVAMLIFRESPAQEAAP